MAAPATTVPVAPVVPPRHVVVINKDRDMLALFRDLLQREGGYRVTTRAYVDRDVAAIAALAPDLIVLDYMWSGEDAGWTLLQMLRMYPATASLPIVLCTGAVRRVDELAIHLAAMAVHVVLKPFRLEHVLATIADGLRPAAPTA